ncbi:MAG: Uma2 family endonuclease [Acidobacteria bacterium]|nr:Uma2 family endonuclease [Acidobacteriota bacterium]
MPVATELAPERESTLDPEKSYELVNGQLEEKEMAGGKHGVIAANLAGEIRNYLKTNKRGLVSVEVHFKIGQNERIPDVAFVSAERIPDGGMPEGVAPFPPDLAIEVVSPNDVHDKLADKVLEYLDGGVKQVWLVSLKLQLITIFRSPTEVKVFTGNGNLECEDLLPGFSCSLKEVFQTGLPD